MHLCKKAGRDGAEGVRSLPCQKKEAQGMQPSPRHWMHWLLPTYSKVQSKPHTLHTSAKKERRKKKGENRHGQVASAQGCSSPQLPHPPLPTAGTFHLAKRTPLFEKLPCSLLIWNHCSVVWPVANISQWSLIIPNSGNSLSSVPHHIGSHLPPHQNIFLL